FVFILNEHYLVINSFNQVKYNCGLLIYKNSIVAIIFELCTISKNYMFSTHSYRRRWRNSLIFVKMVVDIIDD
ncbi:MAG: hypothetical protein LRZ92_00520, partial [Methanosarcinaceae archaeon]|nr:hypothetical protein [Methanosarcinaceae archaeon]